MLHIIPEPGDYQEPVILCLQSDHRIFYSFVPSERGTWKSRAPLLFPINRSSADSKEKYIDVAGGVSFKTATDRVQRYRDDFWSEENSLPVSVYDSAYQDILVGGRSNLKTERMTLSWNESTKSWKSLCPLPDPVHGHAIENLHVFGEHIYEYDKKHDSWKLKSERYNGDKNYPATRNGTSVFHLQKEQIRQFNLQTNSLSHVMKSPVPQGSSIVDSKENRFTAAMGHGSNLKNDVISFDINRRTSKHLQPAPVSGAYSASAGNALFGGLGLETANWKYGAFSEWQEYVTPIYLHSAGEHVIAICIVNQDSEIIEQKILKYKINRSPIKFFVKITNKPIRILWPDIVKENDEPFRISDLLLDEVLILKTGDTERAFDRQLLQKIPSLNESLVPAKRYILTTKNNSWNLVLNGYYKSKKRNQ